MAIFNELYLTELFGFGKKKEKDIQKNLNTQKNKYTFQDSEIKEIEKALKSIVSKYNKDPKIKEEVLKKIHDYDEEIPNKFIKFICNEFEMDDDEISYEILGEDADQSYTIAISDIIERIGKEAQQLLADSSKYKFSYGDGDEGCIWIKKIKE